MGEDTYRYRRTNEETGETRSWIGKPGIKSDTSKKEPFLMLYQEACRDIATNEALQGFDLRVFIFLSGILHTDNWIDVHHARIARQMTTDPTKPVNRSAVSRSIKHLTEQGILLKGAERTYRLNPGIGWKGDKVKQDRANKEHIAGHLRIVRP